MYNGALADMGMGSDPFTGNRYAFGGGNPISRVEIDGHFSIDTLVREVTETVESAVKDANKKGVSGWLGLFGKVGKTASKRNPVGIGVSVVSEILGIENPIDRFWEPRKIEINWSELFPKPDNLTKPQWDEAVKNCKESYGLGEFDCRELPVFVVDGKRTPKIAINDASAIAGGHPFLLHYNGGGKARDLNRELAGCLAAWRGNGGVESCDEYPFAMSMEGGIGAQTMGVPVSEQTKQGSDLGAFVTSNKLKKGDPFLVAVINVRQQSGIFMAP
jgi:hypothetical protein